MRSTSNIFWCSMKSTDIGHEKAIQNPTNFPEERDIKKAKFLVHDCFDFKYELLYHTIIKVA